MENSKKTKYTSKLKEFGPKLKWVLLNGFQDYKLNSKYIDFICPDPKEKNHNPTAKLHVLIQDMLIAEFSPEIQNTKYFNFLVDAVAHNIKKKALKD
jgi:hypothetical protein